MPRPNPHRPFTPDPAQMERVPEISGNAVNGLGETEFRRPKVVYWSTDIDAIAHGKMQEYFYMRSSAVPAFGEARVRRQKINDAPLPPVAENPAQHAPEDWTALLAQFVAAGDCEMVGVAEMNPDWAYDGQEVTQSRVIVVGVQHDYDEISTAPEDSAGLEVVRQYTRAGAAASRELDDHAGTVLFKALFQPGEFFRVRGR